MKSYRTLAQADLDGKNVLLRAGFDVPMENGVVTDTSRIAFAAPTMQYILDHGAALIIIAHQDRPKGKVVPEMSQRPIAPVLEKLLGRAVAFAPSCTGPETRQMVDALAPGQVLLLENLRFDAREEANDEVFAQELASYGQVYVNDAFPNCHRSHASVVALARLLPSYMGLQLEQEVTHLSAILEHPARPLTLIVSGAKVETKLPVIERFLQIGDHILVGGGIANTFLNASGKQIGGSLIDEDFIETAQAMLTKSASSGYAVLHIPRDVVIASSASQSENATAVRADDVPADQAIFDPGPKTVEDYAEVIRASATIVWNGPLGMYEVPRFRESSAAIARELGSACARGATVIAGGGDTLDLLAREHIDPSSFTFVSTGGGAMLEFLSGNDLPALEVLAS